MSGKLRLAVWPVLLVALAALAVACGDDDGGSTSIPPAKRTFYMAAVEPKGSASVDAEAFPTEALPDGGGYVLKEPKDGKWEVETYQWAPSVITVFQGDEVELEILGVNGASHVSSIDGYVESFTVERGKLTRLTFTADQAGVFLLRCETHQPSMTGQLIVLPRT